jgi:hypothetical protein
MTNPSTEFGAPRDSVEGVKVPIVKARIYGRDEMEITDHNIEVSGTEVGRTIGWPTHVNLNDKTYGYDPGLSARNQSPSYREF